ncbi:MAG TPA: RidA family protein [Gaiellaceae bacterium]|nr:RidA family protein [Gaiellaceae bacterium]
MDKRQVNPWTWQDAAGFSQAWRVEGAGAIVFVSGQAPISADGRLVGEGDFDAQVRLVFENLRTVLGEAGMELDAIVKLTVFLTDMSLLRDYTRIKGEFFAGEQPASTAVGVTELARPEMMVEVEAVAVQ